MPPIIKNNFQGGMNLDDNEMVLPPASYEDALNVTRFSLTANKNVIVSNIVGNQEIPYTYHTSSVPPTVIGCKQFLLRNTVIYFVYHPESYHCVLECNLTTRTITKIFENLTDSGGIDVLGFLKDNKITGINIYPREGEGDLLYFLDSLGRPTEMDIDRFKAGEYTPVTRVILDKCKKPSLAPPTAVYANNTAVRSNYLTGLYRFKYRWLYDDFENSVFSPISGIPLPLNVLDNTYTGLVTNNNVINLSVNTGDKNVSGIELCVSFVNKTNNWSDFQTVELIKKGTTIADNTDIPYSFYNNSTYPNVDINESLLLQSYVPDYANAQDMPKGLAYAGITEGLDKGVVENATITVLTVSAGNGGTVGELNSSVTRNELRYIPMYAGNGQYMDFQFTGMPAAGTTVTINIRRKSDHVTIASSTYLTVAGNTSDAVASNLAANNTGIYTTASYLGSSKMEIVIPHFYYEYVPAVSAYAQVLITPPTSTIASNSVSTWKWSSQGTIARQYFDIHGKTNGVYYYDNVSFPAYAEDGSHVPLLPYINYKINDIPPIWAVSFTFLFTKDATTWLFWETNTVIVPTTELFLYFEVTGLLANAIKNPTTANVLSYSFKDGDRMRIIRDNTTNTVMGDTYDAAIIGLVTDPIIDGAVTTPAGRQFIKINKVAPFTSIVASDFYVIELYSPTQQLANSTNQAYYEIGRQYYIIDAGLSTRRHGGEVTDQVVGSIPAEFNFYNGNAYFRARNIIPSTTATGYAIFNVMDKNFVDFYYSAVNNIDGRASIIDINARKKYYPTLIRFGQNFEPNTNINGLGTFYPNDFDEYEISYGDITRIRLKGNYLKIFQKFKIGVVPLFAQITKDASGNNGLVVTDKLLNPIQYRVSQLGLSAPESLASFNNVDYGCDINLGKIWRDSQDGVQPISEIFKFNTWAQNELPLRIDKTKIYGVFNQGRYIIAAEATPPPCGAILLVSGYGEIVCGEISSVTATTEAEGISCAVISSVTAETAAQTAGLTISNESTDSQILSIFPDDWTTFSSTPFPIAYGDSAVGTHGAFSGLFRLECDVTEKSRVEIYINSAFYACTGHIGIGAQNYTFYSVVFGSDDIIEVTLKVGDSCS